MTKKTRKYKIVFPILVLLFLNYYLLSPFIHEHHLDLNEHGDTEISLHSHLSSILKINYDVESYFIKRNTSHSHNFEINQPIIKEKLQKVIILLSSETLYSEDKFYINIDKKYNFVNNSKLDFLLLWEKYVHFASNSSPPAVFQIV